MKRIKIAAPVKRNSTRRDKIYQVLTEKRSFLSSQEIHKVLIRQGISIGIATVYRQLESLVQQGRADTIISPKGERLYSNCSQAETHHHHIICRICGAAEELDIPEVEKLSKIFAQHHKYTDVSHSLELFGVCFSCASIQSSSIKSKRKPKLS